jgi:GntR family transcriptional regulator
MSRQMNVDFPRNLQHRFEQAILNNAFTAPCVFTCAELASRFDVSANDMLIVLAAAHRKGLVVEQDGGLFRILGLTVPPQDSVFSHTQKLGFKPNSQVREVSIKPASSVVAQTLRLSAGEPVYHFVRTRNVNGETLANQTNYIPYEICPGLEQDDVSRYSFQKLLEEKYLTYTATFKEDFSVEPANKQDQKILSLPPDASIWLVRRLALSATGFPVVWSNIRIRPDRWQYVTQLWPSAAEALGNEASRN